MQNTQSLHTSDATRGPKRLGRFRCEKLIGTSDSFETWRARVQGLAGFDRFFAVKCLRADIAAAHPATVARFLGAGRQASVLADERIGRVVEVGTTDGAAFLATEFVHGIDLASLRERAREAVPGEGEGGRRRWLQIVAHVGAEAAAALAAAHAASPPVAHGGLSPGDVLLTSRGGLKMLDFGLRAAVAGVAASSEPARYRAPELSANSAPTAAGDLYALGVVLLELAAGVSLAAPEDRRRALAGVPGALAMVLEALLSPDPSARPSAGRAIESFRGAYGGADEADLKRELGAVVARLSARRDTTSFNVPVQSEEMATNPQPAAVGQEVKSEDEPPAEPVSRIFPARTAPEELEPADPADFAAFNEKTKRSKAPFLPPPEAEAPAAVPPAVESPPPRPSAIPDPAAARSVAPPPPPRALPSEKTPLPTPSPAPPPARPPAFQPPLAPVAKADEVTRSGETRKRPAAAPRPSGAVLLVLAATASAVVAGAGGFIAGLRIGRARPVAAPVVVVKAAPPANVEIGEPAKRPALVPPAHPTAAVKKPAPEPARPTAEVKTPEPARKPTVSAKPSAPPVAAAGVGSSEPGAAPEPVTTGEGKVQVSITSRPPGATLWLDGEERGQTPAVVRLPPGAKVRVVLIRAGHRTAKVTLDAADNRRIEETLEPVPGPERAEVGVRVDCNTPERYPVLVDDRETGLLCPTSRIPLDPGEHNVSLYIPESDQTLTRPVTIDTGIKSIKFRK